MPIRVVAFDGDDTLWHNETHFNFTQAALRDLLRGHAPNADVDARLFETEMANLSLYGYGIKSFTLSMIETALEITDGTIPASDLKVILDWGKRMLREPTELLEGVRETLLGMSQNHQLLLITKGDLFDQQSKLARSGLAERFAGVEILSDKNVDSYRRVLSRRGIDAGEFVMVGNSLRSDVVPVVELGARAVHIPYHVTWQHEQVDENIAGIRANRLYAGTRALVTVVGAAVAVFVIGVGASELVGGRAQPSSSGGLSVETLVAFALYAALAADPLCPPQATISAGPENEEGLNPRGRPSLIGLAL